MTSASPVVATPMHSRSRKCQGSTSSVSITASSSKATAGQKIPKHWNHSHVWNSSQWIPSVTSATSTLKRPRWRTCWRTHIWNEVSKWHFSPPYPTDPFHGERRWLTHRIQTSVIYPWLTGGGAILGPPPPSQLARDISLSYKRTAAPEPQHRSDHPHDTSWPKENSLSVTDRSWLTLFFLGFVKNKGLQKTVLRK